MNTEESIAYQTLLESQAEIFDQMKEAINSEHPVSDEVSKKLLEDSLKNTMDACLNNYDLISAPALLWHTDMAGNKRLSKKSSHQIIEHLPQSEQYFYYTLRPYVLMTVTGEGIVKKGQTCINMLNNLAKPYVATTKTTGQRLKRIKEIGKLMVEETIKSHITPQRAEFIW